ncbi:MAG: DUF3089 domain-containing protein [Croceibacterium sp.]
MARKFLYGIAFLIVLAIAGAIALSQFGNRLTQWALVPTAQFVEQRALADNTYRDPAMWYARPGLTPELARWVPDGFDASGEARPRVAVFFVHPTSYLDRSHWNATLDDRESRWRAQLFVQGLGSAFGAASEVWAPRYRQATFGAFLTKSPEAAQAIEAAYRDIDQAFSEFLAQVDPAVPIVLAGHSQGALHILRLLRERVIDTPLQRRVAMVYPIGWPISAAHDLPKLGLPACQRPDQARCIVTWSSFAGPAAPGPMLDVYRASPGYDGQPRGDGPIECVNPLTGSAGGTAPASANLGTLVPNAALSAGKLAPGLVPAACNADGLLLIGKAPDLGPYVLPGNNYHVYDIPLFWANLRADLVRRMQSWPQ